jgi:hypothetical protein
MNLFSAKRYLFLSLLTIIAGTAAHAAQWPAQFGPSFLFPDEVLETKLSLLPAVGNTVSDGGHTPFSDTYWPDGDIGIAARYDDINGNPTVQKTRSDVVLAADENGDRPTLAQLKNMSQAEINTLSLTEKYDIARSDYTYALTHRIISGQKGDAPGAYGICHGWSAAAINYSEPQKTVYVNKDGIVIPFGASDVKGLIAFYYAFEVSQFSEKKVKKYNVPNYVAAKDANGYDLRNKDGNLILAKSTDRDRVYFDYRQMGSRCPTKHCGGESLDPAPLHLALANLIGKYHRSFIVQANNSNDLWNFPMLGYASTLSGESSVAGNNGAVSKVSVVTDIYFADETEPTHETTNGAMSLEKIDSLVNVKDNEYERLGLTQMQSPGAVDSRHLAYTLFLDADGNIVDGAWGGGSFLTSKKNRNQTIGFAWRASRVAFKGNYSILNELYKPLDSGRSNSYETIKNDYQP